MLAVLLMTSSFLLGQDKLQYLITSSIKAYGPIFGEDDLNSSRLVSLMFIKPIVTDENYRIEPIIFEEIPIGTMQIDGKVKYTFEIKDNILWENGDNLTAEDVVYTYKVIKNPNVECSNVREKVDQIINMRAVGQFTLEVIFNQRSQDNMGALTFHLLPKNIISSKNESHPTFLQASDSFFQNNPVGCGMYKKGPIIGQRQGMLERNDSYFLEDQIPRFEQIVFAARDEEANMVDEFLGNEDYNFLPDVPITRKEDIVNSPDYRIIDYHDFSWKSIAFNLRKPIFQDINLRKAITHAVDKYDLNVNIFRGDARLISGPFPPKSPAYNGAFIPPEFDRILAKEILLDNGYVDQDGDGFVEKDGEKLTFTFTIKDVSDEDEHLATSLKNFLQDIGIDLLIESIDGVQFEQKVNNEHDFDLALYSFAFGTDPSIYTIFHSTGRNNISGCNFPDLDLLLEEASSMGDRDTKMTLYKNLHVEVANKYPVIFLWQEPKFVACHNNIDGISQETLDPLNIFKYIYKW